MKKLMALFLATSIILSLIFVEIFVSEKANATVSTTVASIYVDAPFVQGSYARHFGGVTETFNDQSSGQRTVTSNSQSIVGGTKTSGSYTVFAANNSFGAMGITETPTVNGSGTGFANTDSTGFEITFSTAVKYIGFFWAAGNSGNSLKVFSGSTEIASMSTSNLSTLLGSLPANYQNSNDSITATNGSKYFKKYYFGPPTGYTSETPTTTSSYNYANEPYAYVHIFAQNDESFDKIKIYGTGFEFDNLTVSLKTFLFVILWYL